MEPTIMTCSTINCDNQIKVTQQTPYYRMFCDKCFKKRSIKRRRFVIGDIHGQYEALKEVLTAAMFDYDNDRLICLGDVVDGGYNTYQVVEELLKIKNFILVIGNHDVWYIDHLSSGWAEEIWLQQGGANTLRSYGAKVEEGKRRSETSKLDLRGVKVPQSHLDFFNNGVYYYKENNMVFVHAGIDFDVELDKQCRTYLTWDRSIIEKFKNGKKTKYDQIFIGHTTTQHINKTMSPVVYGKLTCMDCGAGWDGKLALMNIDTRKVFLSKQQGPTRNKIGDKK